MSRVYIGTDYRLLSDIVFFIQLLFRFGVKLYVLIIRLAQGQKSRIWKGR